MEIFCVTFSEFSGGVVCLRATVVSVWINNVINGGRLTVQNNFTHTTGQNI